MVDFNYSVKILATNSGTTLEKVIVIKVRKVKPKTFEEKGLPGDNLWVTPDTGISATDTFTAGYNFPSSDYDVTQW